MSCSGRMEQSRRRARVRAMALGVSACLTIGLAAGPGCGGGGGADGGTAEYGQKFEKPAVEAPPPVEKPDTQKASKALSPRERKALEKGA